MEPIIREYRPGDERAIADVIQSVFEEKGWPWDEVSETDDLFRIQELYIGSGGGFWVLERDGRMIGTVGLRGKEGGLCTLWRLYLRIEDRGLGLGKKLFHHAIGEARERGYRQMEIWSDKTLDVSHEMYKRAGTTSLGDRRVDNPDYGFPYEEWGYLLDL